MSYLLGCLLLTFVLVGYSMVENLLYIYLRVERLKRWQSFLLGWLALFIAQIAILFIIWLGLFPVRGV